MTEFQVEVTDEVTLSRDSMVEHVDHGPMRVSSVRVGPYEKTVELKSEMGPIGLELSDDEIREQWGETIAQDPFELRDPGTARVTTNGISAPDSDVVVSVTTEGPQDDAEAVHTHAKDQIVRAIQAVRDEQPPEECDGAGVDIQWEKIFSDDGGDGA